MTVGELFAGIGGLSLGLERAGFVVKWQVENNEYSAGILARHWPNVPRRRNVEFAGAENLAPVDCIAGGFPCQDISVAGKGVGIGGRRSGLWSHFNRIVGELRPRWVIAENVPALRTRGADVVLADLEGQGYTCWPIVVGARHVGAPHRRDRVFILGCLDYPTSARRAGDTGPSPSWPVRDEARGKESSRPRGGNGRLSDADRCDVRNQPRRRCGASGESAPITRDTGEGLADAERAEWRAGDGRTERTDEPEPIGAEGPGRARERGRTLADGSGERLQRVDPTGAAPGAALGSDRGTLTHGCDQWRLWPAGPSEPQHEWEAPRATESAVGRATHGLPARLAARRRRNELTALGNAVVPQVAELIGRAVLAADAA